MTEAWSATPLAVPGAHLAEGPWWDAAGGRLLWVDIPAGDVYAHVPGQRNTVTTPLREPVGFVLGRRGGGFVAGAASGLVGLDADLEPAGALGGPPDLDDERRINDGVADPLGRVLLGTVDPSGARTGTLWSRSPDGGYAALATDVGMSNGLGFSPDGGTLYYVDSSAGQVDRLDYDVASGRVSGRACLFRVPDRALLPDGLAVDATGCVWVAVWGAGEVWRMTPDGRRTGRVRVPSPRTSSCAFGGPRGDRLYVTTAGDGPDSVGTGGVFVVEVGVTGGPVWTAVV